MPRDYEYSSFHVTPSYRAGDGSIVDICESYTAITQNGVTTLNTDSFLISGPPGERTLYSARDDQQPMLIGSDNVDGRSRRRLSTPGTKIQEFSDEDSDSDTVLPNDSISSVGGRSVASRSSRISRATSVNPRLLEAPRSRVGNSSEVGSRISRASRHNDASSTVSHQSNARSQHSRVQDDSRSIRPPKHEEDSISSVSRRSSRHDDTARSTVSHRSSLHTISEDGKSIVSNSSRASRTPSRLSRNALAALDEENDRQSRISASRQSNYARSERSNTNTATPNDHGVSSRMDQLNLSGNRSVRGGSRLGSIDEEENDLASQISRTSRRPGSSHVGSNTGRRQNEERTGKPGSSVFSSSSRVSRTDRMKLVQR